MPAVFLVRVERRTRVHLGPGRTWDLRPGVSAVGADYMPRWLPAGVIAVAEAELPAGLAGQVARAKAEARRLARPVALRE